jgi:hypothetical protein
MTFCEMRVAFWRVDEIKLYHKIISYCLALRMFSLAIYIFDNK